MFEVELGLSSSISVGVEGSLDLLAEGVYIHLCIPARFTSSEEIAKRRFRLVLESIEKICKMWCHIDRL